MPPVNIDIIEIWLNINMKALYSTIRHCCKKKQIVNFREKFFFKALEYYKCEC